MRPTEASSAFRAERRAGERRAVQRPAGARAPAPCSEPHRWNAGTEIIDYALWATDGPMGRVTALCAEEESLAITEIVAVARRWFWSEQVFVPLGAVRRVDALERRVDVALSRAEIRRFSRRRALAT